ncbi:DUF2202 domain-containing protein [Thalassovita sp.]|uniref:DUF2202 domain-containing protein n=1 Tax=Thalassovita sp. TaxID=1979401 RepID=UPI0029DE7A8D|nr:DUF2202 domain-containing protein [Thalassovita sp.]
MRNWISGQKAGFRFGQRGQQTDTTPPPAEDPAQEDTTAVATYDTDDIATLLYMLEEEKLAGDIYEAFAELYDKKIFENIAASEDNHFDALLDQAESLGLDVDEFVFEPAGTFVDPALQDLYDTLLAQGSLSLTNALEVGVLIEETDITDISAAIEGVEGTALADVYQNLLDGSLNHLAAFEGQLA